MTTEKGTHRLLAELQRTFDRMRVDLDRAEILTAALAGFAKPVPDYEPRFHHFGRARLSKHRLGSASNN